jgi:16S rRNA (uracil1498-N3)-methyltransferase
MHIFFTPDINSEQYTLSEEESKHCSRVLRLKAKDQIHLVDGRGGFYLAEITDDHPKKTVLKVLEKQEQYHKRNHYLHIAVAPTKNMDRLEWFLEKATEIGIDEITPIICDHSERKEVKTERLEKVVVSAMKQSLKAWLPKINPGISFTKFIASQEIQNKYIAHCVPTEKSELSDHFKKEQSYLVLIGPEGDFSETEINNALENGFLPITLGNSRLRTETAALQACFEINYLNR